MLTSRSVDSRLYFVHHPPHLPGQTVPRSGRYLIDSRFVKPTALASGNAVFRASYFSHPAVLAVSDVDDGTGSDWAGLGTASFDPSQAARARTSTTNRTGPM